jgi:hypothetical protein
MPRPKAEGLVFRLQSRIYKASRQNNHGKQNAGTPREAHGWNTGHIDRYVEQRQTGTRTLQLNEGAQSVHRIPSTFVQRRNKKKFCLFLVDLFSKTRAWFATRTQLRKKNVKKNIYSFLVTVRW